VKNGRRSALRIAGLTILFIAFFLALNLFFCNDRIEPIDLSMPVFTHVAAPSSPSDLASQRNSTVLKPVKKEKQTIPAPPEAIAASEDSATAADPGVNLDKKPPFVWADPGPGIHNKPLSIALYADEPADIELMLGSAGEWVPYEKPIPVTDSLRLAFRGTDRAGNRSDPIVRHYFIRAAPALRCADAMVFVETSARTFCIDQYEWPNKKGTFPLGFVNWYMAYDSCRATGKRLCTAVEWEDACAGRNNTQYPYGNVYEARTCNTENDKAYTSGAYGECRSFAGAYDMSGNLREWTASHSEQNPRYYQVYGGFWENRGASTCRSAQYSFYPQNKFVSIGFRCCGDTLQPRR